MLRASSFSGSAPAGSAPATPCSPVRSSAETHAAPQPPTSPHRQVQAFTQLVDQRFRTLKAVQAYAHQLRITPNHLNALCRRAINQTASEVVQARVVAEAQLLLTQSVASVAAIARTLGFEDASYFARYFKKHASQTPLAFRQSQLLARLGPAPIPGQQQAQ